MFVATEQISKFQKPLADAKDFMHTRVQVAAKSAGGSQAFFNLAPEKDVHKSPHTNINSSV